MLWGLQVSSAQSVAVQSLDLEASWGAHLPFQDRNLGVKALCCDVFSCSMQILVSAKMCLLVCVKRGQFSNC